MCSWQKDALDSRVFIENVNSYTELTSGILLNRCPHNMHCARCAPCGCSQTSTAAAGKGNSFGCIRHWEQVHPGKREVPYQDLVVVCR